MAHRRHVIAAALAGLLSPASAFACDRVIVLEYDISFGGYQIELNEVYLDSGGGQFASGGAPLEEWLLPGENRVAFAYDAEKVDLKLYSICEDGSDRRDIDGATAQGKGVEVLAFAVDDPPLRAFTNAEPAPEDALPALWEAVDALSAAMRARDADAVWDLHMALRLDREALGKRLGGFENRLRKIVAAADPVYADDLKTRPVLGGRVWEVYGANYAPPISDDIVEINGGAAPFRTGSYWMLIDGEWSVLVQ